MKYSGYIYGLISGFLWGVTGIAYEQLNINYPITTALSVILLFLFIVEFSSLILSALSHYKIKSAAILNRKHAKLKGLVVLAGVIGGPIGMLSYLQSISYIGVGYAAPISSSYPVFGAFLSFIFLKDYVSKLGIVGIVLSIACVILLSLDVQSSQFSLFGIGLAIICALSWGGEIVLSSYVMNQLPSSIAYFFRQVGSSLGYLILLLFFDIDYDGFLKVFPQIDFVIIIIVIVLSSMLSYVTYYKAISLIKPIRAMMLNITYGFWIVLLGYIWSGVSLKISTIMFICGILLGALFVLKDEKEIV